jgi:hypothetical protein
MLPVKYKNVTSTRDNRRTIPLTQERITLIEQADLDLPDKINLLALLLGHKLITDVAIDGGGKGPERALVALGLPFADNYYIDADSKCHKWIQVAASHATLDYVIQRRDQLTVLEAGVLYGYPPSACLAYIGALDKVGFDKTIGEHFLSGVFSQPYATLEREHFQRIWEDIVAASPSLAKLAKEARTNKKDPKQNLPSM